MGSGRSERSGGSGRSSGPRAPTPGSIRRVHAANQPLWDPRRARPRARGQGLANLGGPRRADGRPPPGPGTIGCVGCGVGVPQGRRGLTEPFMRRRHSRASGGHQPPHPGRLSFPQHGLWDPRGPAGGFTVGAPRPPRAAEAPGRADEPSEEGEPMTCSPRLAAVSIRYCRRAGGPRSTRPRAPPAPLWTGRPDSAISAAAGTDSALGRTCRPAGSSPALAPSSGVRWWR